jgi:hypothetical protein
MSSAVDGDLHPAPSASLGPLWLIGLCVLVVSLSGSCGSPHSSGCAPMTMTIVPRRRHPQQRPPATVPVPGHTGRCTTHNGHARGVGYIDTFNFNFNLEINHENEEQINILN